MWVYVLKAMLLWLCLCKQESIWRNLLLHVSLRKTTPEIGVKLFVVFTFLINVFMRIIYCQTVPWTTYVCCRVCMSAFSDLVLNLNKSGNILFRKMSNGIFQLSIIVIGSRDNSLVHELWLFEWWQLLSYI